MQVAKIINILLLWLNALEAQSHDCIVPFLLSPQGQPINDITHYGCLPWPDMQDLISHCLQFLPTHRPSAQQVFDRLCSAEFVGLKRTIQVQYDHDVDAFAVRVSERVWSGGWARGCGWEEGWYIKINCVLCSWCVQFALQFFTDKRQGKNVEVWMVSSLGTQSMVSLIRASSSWMK